MARSKARDIADAVLRQIEDGTIVSADFAPGSVDSNAIGNAVITSIKLALSAVDSDALADNVVTTNKILDNAVTSDKLDDNITIANNLTVTGTTSISEILEKATLDATTTGTIEFDALTQAVVYYTNPQTANRAINFRGDATTSLNSIMLNGQSLTVALLMTESSTAYYLDSYYIDNIAITPKWADATAVTGGNTNSIDTYGFTLIKTDSATFTTLASLNQFG